MSLLLFSFFFFFNDTATTEIYTLSLHDALPICNIGSDERVAEVVRAAKANGCAMRIGVNAGSLERDLLEKYGDRKSTRLNSSHLVISYAVFCLKKKKNKPYNN